MKILSLYDGMACGMIAMLKAGVKVDSYDAYEIDKYAIKTSSHNFPEIVHHGDVFDDTFYKYQGVDFLIGGSPCTYWSIAQKNNRETEASGLGWELFSQYVKALEQAKPKYFIYENNKSMSKAIRDSIRDTFGFEEIMINSALVSAQTRKRYYWVGKRNENGTYSKVNVEQPIDKGILLKDILETGIVDLAKAHCLCGKHVGTVRDYFKKRESQVAFEPIRVGSLPRPNGELSQSQAMRIYSTDGKSVGLKSCGGGMGGKTGLYAVPVDAELADLSDEYYHGDKDTNVFGKIECKNTGDNNGQPPQGTRVYNTDCKSICMDGDSRKYIICAIPTEYENGSPTKAISLADGKEHQVYHVQTGQITIKNKLYPIKLPDGYYIIRKLTVKETMRLQTVPEWYEFPVSDTQTYKMLGNGWTCDVISWLIQACLGS